MRPPREDPPTWTNTEWAALTPADRDWYTLFWRVTTYFDWKALRELCDAAPQANFERLSQEINYESHRSSRNTYSARPERKSRLSEWDYAWSTPYKTTVKEIVLNTEEPASPTKLVKIRVVIPDYDKAEASKVRHVSAEEYQLTKKRGPRLGVRAEFDKPAKVFKKKTEKRKSDLTDTFPNKED